MGRQQPGLFRRCPLIALIAALKSAAGQRPCPGGDEHRRARESRSRRDQHLSFLFLDFLPRRGHKLFTELSKEGAAHGAAIDLQAEPMRAFVRLPKDRKVAIDPTVNLFEWLFENREGAVAPGYAAVAASGAAPVLHGGLRRHARGSAARRGRAYSADSRHPAREDGGKDGMLLDAAALKSAPGILPATIRD
jgi:hypothetical protein